MRILPYLLTALLGITGCTTKTPSDTYKMKSTAERAVTSLQTVTVTRGDTVEAIVSGIYLNAVYPERYRNGEYFLIALYDALDHDILGTLRLNDSVAPLEHEELADGDPLLQLMPIRKAWNRYYLLRFPRQQQAKALTLTPGNDRYVKGALSFQKASK
jgi:hypothetical protein